MSALRALGLAVRRRASIDYRHLKTGLAAAHLRRAVAGAGPRRTLATPTRSQSHGARRWLVFHGMSFQPSELAKITLILALAYGELFHARCRRLLQTSTPAPSPPWC
jgi:hypothetical protein